MRTIYEFRIASFFHAAIAAVLTLAAPKAALAQGCAMCYTTASAAKQAALEALRNGIIILLVPPLLMFVGILWLAFRRRDVEGAATPGSADAFPPRPPRLTAVILDAASAEKHLPENRRIE